MLDVVLSLSVIINAQRSLGIVKNQLILYEWFIVFRCTRSYIVLLEASLEYCGQDCWYRCIVLIDEMYTGATVLSGKSVVCFEGE